MKANRTHAILPELGPSREPAVPDAFVEQLIRFVTSRDFQGSCRADAMVFAQPDHDGDRSYEREALTEPGGRSGGVSDAEVATLIGHEHPTMPKPIEDTIHVNGTFEGRVSPRVGAAYQPGPVGVPF